MNRKNKINRAEKQRQVRNRRGTTHKITKEITTVSRKYFIPETVPVIPARPERPAGGRGIRDGGAFGRGRAAAVSGGRDPPRLSLGGESGAMR